MQISGVISCNRGQIWFCQFFQPLKYSKRKRNGIGLGMVGNKEGSGLIQDKSQGRKQKQNQVLEMVVAASVGWSGLEW